MIDLNECPVPILQERWEFSKLVEIYERLNPEVVAEIGTFYGGTLWYWLRHSTRVKIITSIDMPITRHDIRYYKMLDCKDLWHGWTKNVQFNVLTGNSRSSEIIAAARNIHFTFKADFLLIDGDHTYRGVKADFENYQDIVKPGGSIVFHDIVGIKGVRMLWKQLKKKYRYTEIYGGKGAWGIGIIEKQ
jgi:cephalosporin hydroxylase